MMKNTEPIESANIPEPHHESRSHDLRHGKRNRQEHELRQQLLRSRSSAAEPAGDTDVPLGASHLSAMEEPLIGVESVAQTLPIGLLAAHSGPGGPDAADGSSGEGDVGAGGMAGAGGMGGILSALASSLGLGKDLMLEEDEPVDETIIGSGDRAHHLAMAPGLSPLTPQRRVSGRDSLVLPPGPKSRAECRRRCGKAGFCDPSSDLGCGGEYCGNANAAAREAL